jgi:hypothetical protein
MSTSTSGGVGDLERSPSRRSDRTSIALLDHVGDRHRLTPRIEGPPATCSGRAVVDDPSSQLVSSITIPSNRRRPSASWSAPSSSSVAAPRIELRGLRRSWDTLRNNIIRSRPMSSARLAIDRRLTRMLTTMATAVNVIVIVASCV